MHVTVLGLVAAVTLVEVTVQRAVPLGAIAAAAVAAKRSTWLEFAPD